MTDAIEIERCNYHVAVVTWRNFFEHLEGLEKRKEEREREREREREAESGPVAVSHAVPQERRKGRNASVNGACGILDC
jgi:hypothetical protein